MTHWETKLLYAKHAQHNMGISHLKSTLTLHLFLFLVTVTRKITDRRIEVDQQLLTVVNEK